MWDGTDNPGTFVNRSLWEYDKSGNVIEFSEFTWGESAQQWIGTYRYTRVLEGDAEAEYTTYVWDSIKNDWVGEWRELTERDVDGNATIRSTYEYDVVTEGWVPGPRYILAYEHGQQVSVLTQGLSEADVWVNSSRVDYLYDSEGRLTASVYSSWDPTRLEFALFSRHLQVYEGNETMISHQDVWDAEANDWRRLASTKEVRVVDLNGSIVSREGYQWDAVEEKWIGISRSENVWDDNGNLIQTYWEEWDVNLDGFMTTYRDSYVRDSEGEVLEYIFDQWNRDVQEFVGVDRYTYTHIGGVTTDVYRFEWDDGAEAWMPFTHTRYEYDSSGTSIASEVAPMWLKVEQNYPNPFSSSTTLSFSLDRTKHVRLVVYDVWGREVVRLMDQDRGPGVHQVVFEANGLPSGSYLARVQAGRQSNTVPMLLVR